MPVYEQKLISPFAVRFTQEHIRTTFRDGRVVEESFREIKAVPGTEGYDLILQAPFPNIEIIRWSPPCQGSSCCSASRRGEACSHWFTLDNRRLYCLQRAAAELWPRRVAVAVDLLYAEPGRVWRKSDSTTQGKTVSIGHSCKGPEISRWDWLEKVMLLNAAASTAVDTALRAVADDDARPSVEQLIDAPGEAGSLMAMLRSEAPLEQLLKGCPTPSTAPASAASDDSDESEEAADLPSSGEALLHAVKRGLEGVWYGGEGETYKFRFGEEAVWTCIREGTNGRRMFTVTYDGDNAVIWWGTAGSYYISAEQVAEEPDELKIYAAQDVEMRRPKFHWHRRGCGPTAAAGGGKAAPGAEPEKAKSVGHQAELEAAAIAEIEAQLRDPSNEGYVRITDWNDRFAKQLGSQRSFLQGRPRLFTVTALRGSRYSVALAAERGEGGGGSAARARAARSRAAPGRKWAQRLGA